MSLLRQVEKFLKQHKMTARAFGIKTMGDPSFVMRLRDGRDTKTSTNEKLVKWMDKYENARLKSGLTEP